MESVLRLQGRDLTRADIDSIRQLIDTNPSWSRRRLSVALCEVWNWCNAKGEFKDMASRTLLVKLHERGHIQLPPRRRTASNRMVQHHIQRVRHDTHEIHGPLRSLRPLQVINIHQQKEYGALFNCLLSEYHYLGYSGSVGENMKYLVLDNRERPLACLLFGSSAWSCADRDHDIGWDKEARRRHINMTTNNTRYLILPWVVKVKHLASHILGLVSRRIGEDWQARYGHPVYLLETFVDNERFQGTCYKAANWRHVGQSKGRSRNDRHKTLSVPVKSIFIYPLAGDFREKLGACTDGWCCAHSVRGNDH